VRVSGRAALGVVRLSEVTLWQPRQPFLYDLTVVLERRERVLARGRLSARVEHGLCRGRAGEGDARRRRAVAHGRVAGVSTMKCDGTGVTRGDRISCAANGLARATAAAASGTAHVNTSDAGAATDPVIGANVIGIALSTAAAGANTSVLLTHSGLVPTTLI
jgi:hypothetical protein